jgi:hypothetical protein
MTGSPWVDGLFAIASALVALYSLGRLVLARQDGVSADLTHLLMAAGMVAMFLPAVDPLPRGVWIGLFAVNGAWLITALPRAAAAGGVFAKGARHRLHPVISAAAMVYMFALMGAPAAETPALALPASGTGVLAHDHGAAGGLSLTPVTVALAVYFLVHAVWSARAVTRVSAGAAEGPVATAPRLLSEPRLAGACHVVMGLGMSYMFAMMVG